MFPFMPQGNAGNGGYDMFPMMQLPVQAPGTL
jgi:hypothetical protein